MSNTVIRVENLSKLYRLGEVGTGSLAHDVNRWWHRVCGKEDPYLKIGQVNDRTKKAGSSSQSTVASRQEEGGSSQTTVASSQKETEDCKLPTDDYVFALKNVSFDVQQGEVLGIIGRNGAGKSTLLKILSRVTVQTTGRIRVKGRIASLLEVGTGFHPELTGRENVYLNGAILGMRKAEIRAKFDEIVDFSGCERYIDTPVKRYSSGMYVRLAFAVAAHLEPEILIVDEVLAVGDAEFQKKCLGKMKDVAGHGRTVLFVSHNMGAVLQLTTRAIVLDSGLLGFNGITESAVQYYSTKSQANELFYPVEHKQRSWTGSQVVKFVSLSFKRGSAIFRHNEVISFITTLKSEREVPACRISLTVFRSDATPVGSCFGEEVISLINGKDTEVLVRLEGISLAPGHYYLCVGVGRGNHLDGNLDYDVVMDVLRFEMQAPVGSASPSASWVHGWGPMIFPSLITESITK